jgi:general secretion pathway protein M
MNSRAQVLLAPYRRTWQRARTQATGYWQGLALKEKRLLLGGGLSLLSLLVWLVLVQPALKSIDHWQAELPRLRSQASAVQALLKTVQAPTSIAGDELEQALRQSLEASALTGHYQLQAPQGGAGPWQLTLTDAPAAAAINWLLDSHRRFSLSVSEAHLQRADAAGQDETAGQISGIVRMDQAPGAKESS